MGSEDLVMPQPLYPQPPEGSFVYQPKLLAEQRPQHAAGIGAVTSEWAFLEEQLVKTLAYSIFAHSAEGGGQVARTMLGAIDSMTLRLEIVEEILKTRIPAEEHKFFVETLKQEIRSRAGERNYVCHSIWYVDDKYLDYVITRIDGRYFKYSVKDFSNIVDRIHATNLKMTEFLSRFGRWDGFGPWQSMHM